MSLSPHQRANTHVKPNAEGIEELGQTSDEVFYNLAAPLEHTGRTNPGINLQAAAGKADKGYQVWGHFQQSGPVKWANQDPVHTNWFSHKASQNFGMDEVRGQGLLKSNLDLAALQQQKLSSGSSVLYSDSAQAALPGMDWDPHGVAAMQHVQFAGHKPGDPQYQSQVQHSGPDATLQSFQVAFGPTKQLQASGYFQSFQSGSVPQSLGYGEQSKSSQQQQQLLQMQHQQQMHHFHQQQQQQQRLHLQQQQQYHHQQQMQQRRQQKLLQPGPCPPQPQPQHQQHDPQLKADFGTSSLHRLPASVQVRDPSSQLTTTEDPRCSKVPDEIKQTNTRVDAVPRRSRRLSKDGQSPPTNHPFKDPAQNGGVGGLQGPSEGVIHSTPRRRRTSKEINLVTLAQKASEMEFLPAKQQEEGTANRQSGMAPLVMPVSVPVRRGQFQAEHAGSWRAPTESSLQLSERKPSVIVTRRRSLRATETLNKEEEAEGGQSPVKRRPRPEPLVIPPLKPCTFIAPPIYSTISPFPSNLRSPVRLMDNPLTLPPYTPPPILSPVREGSGLYFSTFLSSIAAGNQGLPLPPTPKTASKSLLRSSSSEVTPPMPPLIGETTPVSLEPRINIGVLHQAEIPELRDRALSQQDQHKATLVWVPLSKTSGCQEEAVNNLMNLACSSVLYGGGTNTELTHHCLHENRGDVLKTLDALLLKKPIFPRDHHLSNYHYSGSDCWSVDEKRYFNKGISAYRKDFYLVQKVVQSKTLAQCVEFYYTYKKQVKVVRSGVLVYGPTNSEDRAPELQVTQIKPEQPEDAEENKEEDKAAGAEDIKAVTRTLQISESESKVLVLTNPAISSSDEPITVKRETQTPPFVTPKPRPESTARRSVPSGPSKSQGEPEGVFPCKKCNRVFYKVKSRSAHMKSHAEQEKKAAAQRQREEEERRAMWAQLEATRGGQGGNSATGANVQDEDW